MTRRTTIGIAAGITLMVAAAVAAIGVNLGIMSANADTSGPGNFEPVAVLSGTSPSSTTDPGTVPAASAVTGPDGSTPPGVETSTDGDDRDTSPTTAPGSTTRSTERSSDDRSGTSDDRSGSHDDDDHVDDDRGGDHHGGHDDDD